MIVDMSHAAAGRTARAIAAQMGDEAEPSQLPWLLAVPLIGGISAGLWVGIWQLGRLIF